jgi:hypothetical protein
MKTIIVGDLHGRVEIAEQILEMVSDYNIVFIGDYIDSYDRSVEDQIGTLRLVLDAVNSSDGSVKALWGNHELSYMNPVMRCSGYNNETAILLAHLDLSSLLNYTWVDNFLISHAGVSQHLLEARNETIEEYLGNGRYNQIGVARGGGDPVGGLFWCDWFREFEPLPDTPQVVGHSGYRQPGQHKGILQKDNSFCVDCFQHTNEVLVIDNNETSIMSLETGG